MKPQRLEKLSDANWRVLKKALSYSRVARFDSMADFIDALDVNSAESITVDIPRPERFAEPERRGPGRALFGLVVLIGLAAVVGNQMGLLDSLKERYLPQESAAPLEDPQIAVVEPSQPIAEEVASEEAVDEEPVAEAPAVEEPATETVIDQQSLEPEQPVSVPQPEIMVESLIDFSELPPPTAVIRLAQNGSAPESITVRLREGGRTAAVDLIRQDVEFPRTLRLEEVGFSGNRSPWVSGQYEFSDNGFIEFPAGQDRARISLSMIPDFTREADQQATLRIREADSSTSQLAVINVILEDDDQRAFEATLPANTVAFAASQITVNEQDPAVQIDVLRFNPDSTPLVVGFRLRDITATRGEDYFEPGRFTIEFGPGQRVARLLVPLVQDSEYEDNEAFSVELAIADSAAGVNVYHRVAVLIRDDDQ
jgi:hypothetical protein